MEQVIETPLASAGRMRRVLRIVGGLSLSSNARGAIDYTMTQTRNATWLAAATPEQRSYIDHFPALMVAFSALGVWGGAFVISILLLTCRRHAVTAFAVSAVGIAWATVYQWLVLPAPGVRSAGEIAFTVALWAVAIGLFLFARGMKAKGALR